VRFANADKTVGTAHFEVDLAAGTPVMSPPGRPIVEYSGRGHSAPESTATTRAVDDENWISGKNLRHSRHPTGMACQTNARPIFLFFGFLPRQAATPWRQKQNKGERSGTSTITVKSSGRGIVGRAGCCGVRRCDHSNRSQPVPGIWPGRSRPAISNRLDEGSFFPIPSSIK